MTKPLTLNEYQSPGFVLDVATEPSLVAALRHREELVKFCCTELRLAASRSHMSQPMQRAVEKLLELIGTPNEEISNDEADDTQGIPEQGRAG